MGDGPGVVLAALPFDLETWQPALLRSAGILLLLEVAYLVLSRVLRSLRRGFLYHVWAVSIAVVAGLQAMPESRVPTSLGEPLAIVTLLLSAPVGYAFLDAFILRRPWKPQAGPLVPELVRDAIRVAVLFGVILAAAVRVFDLDVSAVLVSSSVASAIVGFALQDVLKNVIAGMAIQVERPFHLGDWIHLDGELVQVVDVTWRSTRLRTTRGTEIVEPNTAIADGRIVNYGRGEKPVAVELEIPLEMEAPPAEVVDALLAAAERTPGVVASPAPKIQLDRYGESEMVYKVEAWTLEREDYDDVADRLQRRAWYQLRRHDLRLAAPVRRVVHRSHEEAEATVGRDRATRARALLAGTGMFEGLNDELLEQLAREARHVTFGPGERLVSQGGAGSSLFLVESGEALVTRDAGEEGIDEIEVGRLKDGDFFGEMSLWTGAPRSANVTALTTCSILELDRAAVAPVFLEAPGFAESLSRVLERRARTTLERVAEQRAESPDPREPILHRIRRMFHAP